MTNAHWEVDHLARADLEALIHQHIVASVSQTPSTLKKTCLFSRPLSAKNCALLKAFYIPLCVSCFPIMSHDTLCSAEGGETSRKRCKWCGRRDLRRPAQSRNLLSVLNENRGSKQDAELQFEFEGIYI